MDRAGAERHRTWGNVPVSLRRSRASNAIRPRQPAAVSACRAPRFWASATISTAAQDRMERNRMPTRAEVAAGLSPQQAARSNARRVTRIACGHDADRADVVLAIGRYLVHHRRWGAIGAMCCVPTARMPPRHCCASRSRRKIFPAEPKHGNTTNVTASRRPVWASPPPRRTLLYSCRHGGSTRPTHIATSFRDRTATGTQTGRYVGAPP